MDYQDTLLGQLDQYLTHDIWDLVYRDRFDQVVKEINRRFEIIKVNLDNLDIYFFNEDPARQESIRIIDRELRDKIAVAAGWRSQQQVWNRAATYSLYIFLLIIIRSDMNHDLGQLRFTLGRRRPTEFMSNGGCHSLRVMFHNIEACFGRELIQVRITTLPK